MHRLSRFAVLGLTGVLGACAAHCGVLDEHASLVLSPAGTTAHPIRVQFAGVSTLLFDDGETAFMTDGFFSRPPLAKVVLSPIEPDCGAIDAGLELLENARLAGEGVGIGATPIAAVVTTHAHYDHALDAPIVASKCRACLVGDASTRFLGLGLQLSDRHLGDAIAPGEVVAFGQWRLTFIPTSHSPSLIDNGTGVRALQRPLTPPRRALAWRRGQTWALLIEHVTGARFLVISSGGYTEGLLKGVQVDVVFLAIGALGMKPAKHREALWREVVEATQPRRVILTHWDNMWRPLDAPLRAMPFPIDNLDRSLSDFRELARTNRVELALPPLFEPFDPLPEGPTRPPGFSPSKTVSPCRAWTDRSDRTVDQQASRPAAANGCARQSALRVACIAHDSTDRR